MNLFEMTKKVQDEYSNATSTLVKKFVDSNQRKRINLINEIESEVEGIFNIGYKLFDDFDPNGDDWSAGWILQVLQRHQKEFLSEFLNKQPIYHWDSSFNWLESPC